MCFGECVCVYVCVRTCGCTCVCVCVDYRRRYISVVLLLYHYNNIWKVDCKERLSSKPGFIVHGELNGLLTEVVVRSNGFQPIHTNLLFEFTELGEPVVNNAILASFQTDILSVSEPVFKHL